MNDSDKHHDTERLDELVRELATDYNAPPRELDETRRAEIFNRIQDERRRRAQKHTPAPRPRSRRLQWVAMAAVLLIGIAIGRWEPTTQDPGTPDLAQTDPAHEETGKPNLYRFATRDYLERTENLLVMLQRTAYSPDANTPFGTQNSDPTIGWANDLLRETRMLQDSPATRDDVHLSQLLEDLELLLAQIVQATNRNDELNTEDHQITDPAVLQRLRNEIDRSPSLNEI
jgi:hypothetical protein